MIRIFICLGHHIANIVYHCVFATSIQTALQSLKQMFVKNRFVKPVLQSLHWRFG